ncbi:MAG: relaxase/mobilization nuclease domain-containing protein [Rhodothermales bacterium]
MITKVIGNARGFYDVARYLTKDRATGEDRDTGFRMGYNVSPDAMEAAREMSESSQGRLMHEPCLHVVLAPAPAEGAGERFGPAGLDHMTSDLIREMGWQDYQILAVEHLDTDHQHVHLMINRAHPLEAGESIDGYYLYKDLRRWEQDYAERRQHAAFELKSDEQSAALESAEMVGVRLEEATEEEAIVHEPSIRDYEASPLPKSGSADVEHAAGDRASSPRDGHGPPDHAAREEAGRAGTQPFQRSERPASPAESGPHRLTNLDMLSEKAGLGREVSTIAELERLAHEKEMALAMLTADAVHQKTMGQALLSDEGRRLLRQTAHEIDVILERQQGLIQETVEHRPKPEPIHLGDGMTGSEPSLAARPVDLHERIKESYQDLLTEARPYWMHPEAAVRDMKDLAVLRDPEAVIEVIRHEPEAVGERTTIPMSEADADRVAEAYRQYEAYRREYVAEVMDRMDLQGERVPTRPDASERSTGAQSKEPARSAEPSFGQVASEAARSADPVAQAEQLFFRDVTSRLLQERTEQVQTELGKARAHAGRLHEAVHERAYHHLYTALRETYKDPAEAFKRLEAYHRRGQADLATRKPELLGEMKHIGVRERARGDTPRKRAADIVRRYGEYVEGPEVHGRLAAVRGRARRLQEQRKVLATVQQRIGTPEAVQRKYGEMRKALTAGERRRLGIRLKHLPGSEVRRRSGELLKKALREYPGTVRPGQIKGLASQKAVNRATKKSALGVGKKMAVKQPLQFAMRAGSMATRVASAVYQGARVFFER